jgi:hypothetical protein
VASEAERYLRGLAVERLRVLMPEARIVHELNVETGQCRVDLAAIAPARLVFVEIKSRKDTLDRLPEQVRVFAPACHRLIVAYASERWSVSTIYKASDYRAEVWAEDQRERWTISGRETFQPPNTSAMLNLLWREELYWEAVRARLQPAKRESRSPLMRRLWETLSGREVVAAVCRQLRARHFAEADPPVMEPSNADQA